MVYLFGNLFAHFGTGSLKFFFESIEEKWAYNLFNVRHRCVVHTEPGAMFRSNNCLYHRAEYVRVDFAPVVFAAVENQSAGAARKHRNGITVAEQTAIDVWENLVELRQSRKYCGVIGRHGKESTVDKLAEVGAVLLCVGFERVGKQVIFREKTGVLGKETEQQTRHKHVERMNSLRVADIVVAANIIKELRHQLGRFHVGFGFFGKLNFFDTCKRREKFKVLP